MTNKENKEEDDVVVKVSFDMKIEYLPLEIERSLGFIVEDTQLLARDIDFPRRKISENRCQPSVEVCVSVLEKLKEKKKEFDRIYAKFIDIIHNLDGL